MDNLGLVPLANFGQLNDNLFRSAQPRYGYQFEWLKKKLELDYIIDLRSEADIDRKIAPLHDIKVIKFTVDDHHAPLYTSARRFIRTIQENQDKKVLFHCLHGHGRTSTFAILARISQGWTLEKALAEEKQQFGYNFKHPEQLRFLEKYFS